MRACGYFTHRYGKIERLDSLNEYWLSTEALLRDDFNIEFFQTAADQYVSLEVNMRPPGGFTTDMFNYACDIDKLGSNFGNCKIYPPNKLKKKFNNLLSVCSRDYHPEKF